MPVCAQCGTENPDIAKFCLACGSPLVAPEPADEERKIVTAVFTDIVGSTARAESLDPEDVRAMLAPYYARLRRELERFGGTVEKFIGDAVVAVFGAPVAHEDDPERAVRAALAIGDAVAALNVEQEWLDLHIRTAVNTGEALVVVGASAAEGEGMAAGDVMNTAARLQGAAPVDGIAVGAATYRATAHVFEYQEAEPIAAKGKAQPVPVWIVLGEKVAPKRPEPWGPLVGREEEITRLMDLWERALTERRTQLVTVLGPPGIGKSRLLVELSQRVAPGVAMHWGRCLPYGEGITYWPVSEIVKDAAGILSDDDPPGISRKLGTLLENLPTENRDELRTMAAALSNLLGVLTTPEGTYSAEEIGQAELHWGIGRLLELRASQGPLILIFEDLHWAEPTLLELILSLLESPVPLLVIGTARPEFGEARPDFAHSYEHRHVLELQPLDQDASVALLEELVGSEGPNASRFALLLEKAGGNPLFLEETVRMLMDADLLGEDTQDEALPVPESLQALIGSRLDALPRDEKRTAQQASIVGAVFWHGAVAHLAGASEGLEERLGGLERRDFIHARAESSIADDREFGFKHILIRDVAYERLPKGRRAELHVRFSEWLSDLPGSEQEFIEILAYHLEQACRLAREVQQSPVAPPLLQAAQALQRSAEKARLREGTREAQRFYARALELLGEEHREMRAELTYGLARIAGALGDLRDARAKCELVAEEAVAVGRPDLRAQALLGLANLDQQQGRADDARPRLSEAATIASKIGDRSLQVRSIFESANLRAWFEADADGAAQDLRRALALTAEMDDRALRIEAYMRLGTHLLNTGELVESERALLDAAALAGETGSFRDDARVTSILAYVMYFRDLDEAERLATHALEWFERLSDSYLEIQNLRLLAKCALARGDAVLAEERLTEALPLALESGGWTLMEIYRYLAEALVEQGRLDDARDVVDLAARNLPEEDPYGRAAVVLASAIVAAAAGEHVGASAGFTEALGLLEQQQLLIDLGEARIVFARALRRLGETAGATIELERARQIFARMQAKAVVGAIDRELEQMTAGAGFAGPRTVG